MTRIEPSERLQAKTSPALFASEATRLFARLAKQIQLPSAEMAGEVQGPFASAPTDVMETRCVVLLPSSKIPLTSGSRSTRKMSSKPLESPETRLEADDEKVMKRPLAEMCASLENEFAGTPPEPTETKTVVPSIRSRTYTSVKPEASGASGAVD